MSEISPHMLRLSAEVQRLTDEEWAEDDSVGIYFSGFSAVRGIYLMVAYRSRRFLDPKIFEVLTTKEEDIRRQTFMPDAYEEAGRYGGRMQVTGLHFERDGELYVPGIYKSPVFDGTDYFEEIVVPQPRKPNPYQSGTPDQSIRPIEDTPPL